MLRGRRAHAGVFPAFEAPPAIVAGAFGARGKAIRQFETGEPIADARQIAGKLTLTLYPQ
ncbi:hypothetical protein AQ477_16710 [Burkholderia thailandensis]|nr:hypothetical protein AQ475_16045 [Burkholderia thailandensis]AOJ57982.1 hypothetical protein AQ477_16710 [Burkholderia thailandensis]KXF61134.1 hypothetical protein AQ476_07405 [Burkholderia thailandensis]